MYNINIIKVKELRRLISVEVETRKELKKYLNKSVKVEATFILNTMDRWHKNNFIEKLISNQRRWNKSFNFRPHVGIQEIKYF